MWRRSKHCTPNRQRETRLDRGIIRLVNRLQFLALLWHDSDISFLGIIVSL
uniref:F16P2 n=1 Tax=Arundo donax TaxID=35708 RepID=A0A0A8XTC9_ARUDO